MNASRLLRSLALAAIATAAASGLGCSKKTTTVINSVPPPPPQSIDADPFALLPFGALAVANLDAHLIVNSTAGGDLAALGERLVPFGAQIDFQVKRDLDHAYFGMYSFSGADFVGVLSGTFHPDKLEAAAGKGISTPGGVVVVSTYAGRKLYTVANNGFTMLSEHTALVGSEAAMRRALDRIQAGTIKREIAPWMSDWVTQDGYPVLVASDVTKQSFGKTVTNMLPWVQGVQYVRVRGRFNPDTSFGMSGALTYPDNTKAQAAASGLSNISKSFTIMAMLKVIGIDPLVRNMTVTPSGNDVQFTTVIDEKNLRGVIHLLTDWIGSGAPPQLPNPPNNGGGGTSI
jgi:hypothetical protein